MRVGVQAPAIAGAELEGLHLDARLSHTQGGVESTNQPTANHPFPCTPREGGRGTHGLIEHTPDKGAAATAQRNDWYDYASDESDNAKSKSQAGADSRDRRKAEHGGQGRARARSTPHARQAECDEGKRARGARKEL